MNSKIKINIYGNMNTMISGSRCNKKCNNCFEKCNGCKPTNNKIIKVKTSDLYYNLVNFLTINHMQRIVDINFIELDKNSPVNEESIKVKDIIKKGFEPPITVIGGIIRYYGGISNILVYRDILELIS